MSNKLSFYKGTNKRPPNPKTFLKKYNPSSSLTCFRMRNKLRVKNAQFWFANITFHKNDLPRTRNWCTKRIPTSIIIRLRIRIIGRRVSGDVSKPYLADYNKHLRSGWNQQNVMFLKIFCLAEQP